MYSEEQTRAGSSPARVAEHVAMLMERAGTSAERELFVQALAKRVPQSRGYTVQLDDADDIVMHTHISDGLPAKHPLCNRHVACDRCDELVHAENNECVQTWFEFRGHVLCASCLKQIPCLYAIEAKKFMQHALGA
jgi:formylmethanofuran dehydrogenase subunit E